MAKLSLGQSTGDTSRKVSKRLLGQYGVDSTITTQSITPPGLKPSASIVDTYQQVEKMNVPSVQLGKFADMSIGFDNSKDLQNLANSLGQFNSQLVTTTGTLAKRKKQIDTEAKDFSKSLALQNFGSKKSPVEILQDTRQDLSNVIADKNGIADFTIVAKRVDLVGDRSVVGRGMVIHADRDDLGKGGDAESLKTGNAGDRLACGIVALRD